MVLLATLLGARPADAMPAGFRLDLVADGLEQPTSIAFLPDGRLLATQKTGSLTIVDPSGGIPAPHATYLSLPDVDAAGERGVQNVVLDPDFATTGHLYVFYTRTGGVNQVVRYTHRENAGGASSSAAASSAFVVWEHPNPATSCCHMGGGMTFGPDGLLYITTGEDFTPAHSQDLTHGGGKIHRVRKDGSVPPNPFADGPGPNLETVWARGLRNPFRASWDPISDRLVIGTVGGNAHARAWEDIHVGRAGANYGWPTCGEGTTGREADGSCTDPALDDPLFSYPHAGSEASVTGGVRYTGTAFPQQYQGAYFYGDFARGFIRYLTFEADGSVASDNPFMALPDDDAGNVVDIEEGPDGALYYVQIAGSFPVGTVANSCEAGCIRRVVHETGNAAPVITTATATPSNGAPPLEVQFSAAATDAEGDPLTFTWDFGDGATGTGATTTHTYTTTGRRTVTVTVADGTQTSTARLSVAVGSPPLVTITDPAEGQTFRAGETLTFDADATDPDGAALEESAYEWVIQFKHNDHLHPVLGPVTGSSVTYTVPTSGHSYNDETSYVATVEVTDSDGLTTTETVQAVPEEADITLRTSPAGLAVHLDGIPMALDEPYDTLIGFTHQLETADQCLDGTAYAFESWSDGGAASHAIAVPEVDTTYVATFTEVGPCALPEGAVLHLEGDTGVAASGGVVSTWDDRSGRGNDLVATGDPEVGTSPSGAPAVVFDGAGDVLQRTAGVAGLPTGAADRSVFLVGRYTSKGYGGFAWGAASPNRTFGLAVGPPDRGELMVQGWGLENDFASGSVGAGSGWLVQSAVVAGNQLRHYGNGALVDSRAHAYRTTADRIVLGAEIDGSPQLDMAVGGVLVYDRALTDAERTQVESYLAEKYLLGDGGDTTAPVVVPEQVFSVSETAMEGSPVGTVAATDDVAVSGFSITAGDPAGAFAVDGSGALYVADPSTLDAATVPSYSLTVEAVDAAGNVGTGTVVVEVTAAVPDDGLPDGAVLHLEGDSVRASSGVVSAWADGSGRGNDLAASGDPEVGSSPSGAPVVVFDGAGDVLQRTAGVAGLPTGASDRSVFLVGRYTSPGYGGFAWGRAATNRTFGLGVGPPERGELMVQGWGTANDFASGSAGAGAGWLVQSAVVAGNQLRHYRDGSLVDSRAHVYGTSADRIVLGAEIDGTPQLDMAVGGVLVYDRALTDAERRRVEAYLAEKYLLGPDGDTTAPVLVPGQAYSVSESAGAGTTVGAVVATDNVAVTGYSITGGDPSGAFAIDDGGTLSVADPAALDAAATPSYSLTVEAVDGAGNVGRSTVVVEVTPDDGLPDGAVLHLEADSGVTASGGVVSVWRDRSGRGNDLAASGDPAVGSSPTGAPAVVFDGSGDLLQRVGGVSGLPTGAGDRTVFLAARYTSTGYGGFAWGTAYRNRTFGLVVGPPDTGELMVQGWGVEYDHPSGSIGAGAGWLVQSAVVAGNQLRHFRDGTLLDSRTHTYATTASRIVLGGEIDGTPQLDMAVGAVLVYDRALTDAERAQVEAYLTEKYVEAGP